METEPTVFIVDDDPAVRQALTVLIRSMHLRAEAYESAQQFLDAYGAARPGCLLLDVRMPGISGLELLEQLNHERGSPAGHRHVGLWRRADGGAGDEGRGGEFSGETLPRSATLGGDSGGAPLGRRPSPALGAAHQAAPPPATPHPRRAPGAANG